MRDKLSRPAENPQIKTVVQEREGMEFLKSILGDGYADFEQRLTAYNSAEKNKNKQIKLVNLNSGEYVSKKKYAALERKAEGCKARLESFQAMDVEAIKKSAEAWKRRYEQDTKKLQEDIRRQQHDFEAERYLDRFLFSSSLARKAAVNEFKKQKFKLEDGKFQGADDFMRKLQEEDPTAFIKEEAARFKPNHWVRGISSAYKPDIVMKEEAYLAASSTAEYAEGKSGESEHSG